MDTLKKGLQEQQKNKDSIRKLKDEIAEHQAEIIRTKIGRKKLLGLFINSDGKWSEADIDEMADEADNKIAKLNKTISMLKDRLNGEKLLTHTLSTLQEISLSIKQSLWNYTEVQKRDFLLKVIKRIEVDFDSSVAETERDCWQIKIDYVFDIVELKNHFRLPIDSQPSCPTCRSTRPWKQPKSIR